MHDLLTILIIIFGIASYIVGAHQILRNAYRPTTFSRVVWLLLAVNSFAGVVASKSSSSSIVLAAILLSGNAMICILSFWKGSRSIGRLEYLCSGLLLLSGVVWIVSDAPLVNLSIGLLAHFIGAAPTYRSVWQDSRSENAGFWALFFVASVLSVLASHGGSLQYIVLPVYFSCFDGSMFALSLRHHFVGE